MSETAHCPRCGGRNPSLPPNGERYCTPLSCDAWTFTARLTKEGAKPIRPDGRADLALADSRTPLQTEEAA